MRIRFVLGLNTETTSTHSNWAADGFKLDRTK